MKQLLTMMGLTAFLAYCGGGGKFDNGTPGTANVSPTKTKTNTKTDTGTNVVPPPGDDPSAGESFFLAQIKPYAVSKCGTCHKEGGATGSIFDHSQMLALLSLPSGSTAKTNNLFKKLRDPVNHPGKDVCGADDGSPCKEVQSWWDLELGTPQTTSTSTSTSTNTGTGATAEQFFTLTVLPAMQGPCLGCHSTAPLALNTYQAAKQRLSDPAPVAGTTTNNKLINKPTLTNGTTSHGGGKTCASPDQSPCKEFQEWHRKEFP